MHSWLVLHGGEGVPTAKECSVCHAAGRSGDFVELMDLIIEEGYGDRWYEREIYWGRDGKPYFRCFEVRWTEEGLPRRD